MAEFSPFFFSFAKRSQCKLMLAKKITSVDLNDKTIASLQLNMCPGH